MGSSANCVKRKALSKDKSQRDLELIEAHLSDRIESEDLAEFQERWSDSKFQQQYFIVRGMKQGLEAETPDELEVESLFKGGTIRILWAILAVLLVIFAVVIYMAFQI